MYHSISRQARGLPNCQTLFQLHVSSVLTQTLFVFEKLLLFLWNVAWIIIVESNQGSEWFSVSPCQHCAIKSLAWAVGWGDTYSPISCGVNIPRQRQWDLETICRWLLQYWFSTEKLDVEMGHDFGKKGNYPPLLLLLLLFCLHKFSVSLVP